MNFEDRRKQILQQINYQSIAQDKQWPEEILAYQKLAERGDVERRKGGFPYKIYIFSAKDKEDNAPLFICIHGGGWLKGHMENDFSFAALMADRIKGVVFDLDYTTTAYGGFETMLSQAVDTTEFALASSSVYGYSPERITIGGFSSGAHLAIAAVLKYAEEDRMPFALQVPAYAPVDLRDCYDSSSKEMKSLGNMSAIKELVFSGHPEKQYNPLFSPILTSMQLLHKYPSTLMISAGKCPFCAQDHAYASQLARAGVFVSDKCFNDSSHGFIPHFRDEWKSAVQLMALYIRNAHLAS